jgi:hypothetical protein
MNPARRFLLASSLARLVLRERPATQIVEGHFPASDNRLSYVLFEDSACQLVLVANQGSPEVEEERTEVPASRASSCLMSVQGHWPTSGPSLAYAVHPRLHHQLQHPRAIRSGGGGVRQPGAG